MLGTLNTILRISHQIFAPMAESMIVLRWLEAIHPSLHRHIQETRRASLFTIAKPSFADIQPDLCEPMDSLLQEIEQVDGVSALFAQDVTPVEVNRVTSRIGGRGGFKNIAMEST